MPVEALNTIRQLVIAGLQASAEYLDVDLTADTITIRDNGVHRCCPGVLRPSTDSTAATLHASCGGNVLRCKQATEYQNAAVSLGENVLMICCETDSAKAVLWKRPKGTKEVQVVACCTYRMLPKATNSGDMSAPDADELDLQPCEPLDPAEWQRAVSSVSSCLSEGQTQLEALIQRTGTQASCLHVTGLHDTYQVKISPGSVLLLPPGPSPPMPVTATGRVLVDLGRYLGMLLTNPTAAMTLQAEGVSEVHLTDSIKVSRQEFGPVPVSVRLGNNTLTATVGLVLGYDEDPATTREDEFGIHVYVKDYLVDAFFKVPAMLQCALPGLQQRLLGVATISGVRDLPQPGFLYKDATFRPLLNQLDSWCSSYLRQQRKLRLRDDDSPADTPTAAAVRLLADQKQEEHRAAKRARVEGGQHTSTSGGGGAVGGVMRTNSISTSQHTGGLPGATKAERGPSGGAVARVGKTGLSRQRGQGRWQAMIQEVLDHLMQYYKANGVYNQPVDPTALNIPDYFTIVKLPMDFGTIANQLKDDVYTHYTQVIEHMLLVLDNCCTYNPPHNDFHKLGQHMEQVLLKKLEPLLPALASFAEADPPQEPLPEHEYLHNVPVNKTQPPKAYPGVWPPVGCVESESGLPLAAVRPYTPQGADATLRNVRARIDTVFSGRAVRGLTNPPTTAVVLSPNATGRSPLKGGATGSPGPGMVGGAGRPLGTGDFRASLERGGPPSRAGSGGGMAAGRSVTPPPAGIVPGRMSQAGGDGVAGSEQQVRRLPGSGPLRQPAANAVKQGLPRTGSGQMGTAGMPGVQLQRLPGQQPAPVGGAAQRQAVPGAGPLAARPQQQQGGPTALPRSQPGNLPGTLPLPGSVPLPRMPQQSGGPRPAQQAGVPVARAPLQQVPPRGPPGSQQQQRQQPSIISAQPPRTGNQAQQPAAGAAGATSTPIRTYLSQFADLMQELVDGEAAGTVTLPPQISTRVNQAPSQLRQVSNTVSILLGKLKEMRQEKSALEQTLAQRDAMGGAGGASAQTTAMQNTISALQARCAQADANLSHHTHMAEQLRLEVRKMKTSRDAALRAADLATFNAGTEKAALEEAAAWKDKLIAQLKAQLAEAGVAAAPEPERGPPPAVKAASRAGAASGAGQGRPAGVSSRASDLPLAAGGPAPLAGSDGGSAVQENNNPVLANSSSQQQHSASDPQAQSDPRHEQQQGRGTGPSAGPGGEATTGEKGSDGVDAEPIHAADEAMMLQGDGKGSGDLGGEEEGAGLPAEPPGGRPTDATQADGLVQDEAGGGGAGAMEMEGLEGGDDDFVPLDSGPGGGEQGGAEGEDGWGLEPAWKNAEDGAAVAEGEEEEAGVEALQVKIEADEGQDGQQGPGAMEQDEGVGQGAAAGGASEYQLLASEMGSGLPQPVST